MTQDKAPRRVTPIGWTALGLAGAAMSAAVAAEAPRPASAKAACTRGSGGSRSSLSAA